ncbi:DUF4303 domain-containing protein [Massilia pseudoviolaceinigra]|uniref:DUF4303 domain-containing protein n=1 Tax=Massilia pseudoviolaceinigra TaxID=3057165 RepID=UPI0027968302|nr:DUF4303 domain-containing protein [Massilia sp. CCM 9206]MDQ1919644.1 DUF4303 domain-containing protein [Massilia sp. CCM 9206]
MTTNWSLFHKYAGTKPRQFVEVRDLGTAVWSATGMAETWGTDTLDELASPAAAQARYAALCADAVAAGFTLTRQANVDLNRLDAALLASEIRDGARNAFNAMRAAHSDQTLNAFALISDDSAMTIVPLANSVEALNEDGGGDDILWNPSEWSFFEEGAWLDIAYRMILPYHRDLPNEVDIDALRAWVFGACSAALQQLADEGLFGSAAQRDAVALLFHVTDGDGGDDVIEELNTPASFRRYAAWRATWDKR